MSPAALVDHLESTHHAYLRVALPRLCALADKVASVHGERHPELSEVARLVVELRADLEPHLLKEERVLFPMVRELAGAAVAPEFHCGTLANPIRVMSQEHDAVGELLALLRATTGDYAVPADGCASYAALYTGLAELEADTHLHVHKENNVLFPAVLAGEAALVDERP
jgi:regulator of cell morphogenesis and NO signaling